MTDVTDVTDKIADREAGPPGAAVDGGSARARDGRSRELVPVRSRRRAHRTRSRRHGRQTGELGEPGDWATLDELIAAHWRLIKVASDGEPDPADQRRLQRVRRAYERQQGVEVLDSYFGKKSPGSGAVLTDDNDIHLRYPPEQIAMVSPEFEGAIWRAVALCRRANEQLSGSRQRLFVKPLYSVVVYLLGVLDAHSCPPRTTPSTSATAAPPPTRPGDPASSDIDAAVPTDEEGALAADEGSAGAGEEARDTAAHGRSSTDRVGIAITTANRQLDEMERHLAASALQQARHQYLLGMSTIGVPVLLLVGAGVVLVGLRMDELDTPLLLGLLGFGGMGAALSVLTRVTSALQGGGSEFTLDYEAGRFMVTLAGAFRPIVGAIFAIALFVLIEAGLLPLDLQTPAGADAHYAYWALAFVAGFTERYAQDAVSATKVTRALPVTSPEAAR